MTVTVGQTAPDFTVITTDRKQVRLSELVQDRPAVLAYYYFAFSSG
ncbi:redoxin domain-containing protein [Sphaerobacter thermophilus]